MPNLRIIHANYADQATSLSASTTAGALAAAYMQTDRKGEPHRSTGTSVTYTLTWTNAVQIGAVALPATNLTAAATIRVRLYSDTACTAMISGQDSGTVNACPGVNPGLWASTGARNVNSFAYAGASKSAVWFADQPANVKGAKIDLVDGTNPAGYIDCARVVAGPYFEPAMNAGYGASLEQVDTTENTRLDSGDLASDRGTRHDVLKLNLACMNEADRATLMRIIRGNGVALPVFLSLLPSSADAAAEHDFSIYGKRKNAGTAFENYAIFSNSIEIEGW